MTGRRPPYASGATSGCSRRGPSSSTRPLHGCWSPPAGSLRTPATRPEPSGSTSIWRRSAAALGERVRYDARVTGVSRRGRDRLVDADRGEQPFTVHVTTASGTESRFEAQAVIDASGTWRRPNPAGADGLPALGERASADLRRTPSPTVERRSGSPGGTPSCSVRATPRSTRSSSWTGSLRSIAAPGSPGRCAAAAPRTPSVVAPPTSCRSAVRWGSAPEEAVDAGRVDLVERLPGRGDRA